MTDSVQGKPEPAAEVAGVQQPRSHVFDVLAALCVNGTAEYEPDRIRVCRRQGLLDVDFGQGPTPVVAWAVALKFARPGSMVDPQLRQTIVETTGELLGWKVTVRHVHTAPVVPPDLRRTDRA